MPTKYIIKDPVTKKTALATFNIKNVRRHLQEHPTHKLLTVPEKR